MGLFLSSVLSVILCLAAGAVAADDVRIAVASNFLAPARVLVERFQEQTGHKVRLSSGSTGKLYAQIRNGAPFDVFLGANAREPERLEEERLAVPGSRFTYAEGRLVLWSPEPGVDSESLRQRLTSGEFRRLAIANARTAPYGAAAAQALSALGLEGSFPGRIVFGENIAQAYQFVATGNADLGLVALSQIKARERPGSLWLVQEELHKPIRQQAVLLMRAAEKRPAQAFLAYLEGDDAKALIRDLGYRVE